MIDGTTWLYASVWSDGTWRSGRGPTREHRIDWEPVENVGRERTILVQGRLLRFVAHDYFDPRRKIRVEPTIRVYVWVGERTTPHDSWVEGALRRYDRIRAWLQQPDVAVACDQLHEEGVLAEPTVAAIWRHKHLNQKIHERIAKGRAA